MQKYFLDYWKRLTTDIVLVKSSYMLYACEKWYITVSCYWFYAGIAPVCNVSRYLSCLVGLEGKYCEYTVFITTLDSITKAMVTSQNGNFFCTTGPLSLVGSPHKGPVMCSFDDLKRDIAHGRHSNEQTLLIGRNIRITVKPVYIDHLMGYFSAFWSSSRWLRAT